jgi:hypothetical protein
MQDKHCCRSDTRQLAAGIGDNGLVVVELSLLVVLLVINQSDLNAL